MKVFNHEQVDWKFDGLIPTECDDCFIRVVGTVDDEYSDATMYLGYLTHHNNPQQLPWKWRLKRIWAILRGDFDPNYEILSKAVADQFVNAVTECRDKVFPEKNGDNNG